ncbi:hypothetical protein C0993_006916 [Termitomyces sp. T159_Od127]|nr:hypothetical protein C0993_006916 [Termitomyces sp. T159_Od127]
MALILCSFRVPADRQPMVMARTIVNAHANGYTNGIPDLGRFVGVWKKEQKIQADVAADMQPVGREEQRKLEREKDDAIVKSSTDRLSAVVDWLTDQMPSPPLKDGKSKSVVTSTEIFEEVVKTRVGELSPLTSQKEGKTRMKNELASKKDLERFYIALSRKLYDEGL